MDAARATGRAVIANFGGTALGDIALVPAPFLKHPKGIRDITEWYMSLKSRRDYVHQLFARQTEIALGNLERVHRTVGDAVDAVFLCGTDFGTQTSSFCSVATFRELWLPYYKRSCATGSTRTRRGRCSSTPAGRSSGSSSRSSTPVSTS